MQRSTANREPRTANAGSRAFTLIEILVATALGVAMIAAVWGGFRQAMSLVAKAKAKAALNSTARYLYLGLSEQAAAVHPSGAIYLGAEAPSAAPGDAHDGRITLVFLAGVANHDNFGQAPANSGGGGSTDQAWVMWRWTRPQAYVDPGSGATVVRAGRLETALGPFRPLADKILVDWKPGAHSFQDRTVRSFSQPRRTLYRRSQLDGHFEIDAGKDRIRDLAALEDNAWFAKSSAGVDADNEMGDLSRLFASLTLVSDRVNGFAITVVQRDGSHVTADSASITTAEHFWDGLRFDAQPDVQETPAPKLPAGVDQALSLFPWK